MSGDHFVQESGHLLLLGSGQAAHDEIHLLLMDPPNPPKQPAAPRGELHVFLASVGGIGRAFDQPLAFQAFEQDGHIPE